MALYAAQHFLLKPSTGYTHNFYLASHGKIEHNIYDQNGRFNEKVPFPDETFLDFSFDIDSNDRIHLVGITNDGQLLYFLYVSNQWKRHVMMKFNLKSNNYKNLILKVHGTDIHIFYSFSNLINARVWSIQHIFSHKNNWDKKRVISFTPGKYISPFYVDFDQLGNIHLIYKDRVKGLQCIFYTTFNTFLNKWLPTPQRLYDETNDQLHPYLFTDKRNTVHVVWSSLRNNNLSLNYMQLSTVRSHSSWRNFKLPKLNGNITHPLLFEDREGLKLLYKENDLLKCLISTDHGHNWMYDEDLDINNKGMVLIRFATNHQSDQLYSNVNHIYGTIEDTIALFGCPIYKSNLQIPDINLSHQNESSTSSKYANSDTICKPHESSNQTPQAKEFNQQGIEKESISMEQNDNIHDAITNPSLETINLKELEDEHVKAFINNINNHLNQIFDASKDINSLKLSIEDVIVKNSKVLDTQLKLHRGDDAHLDEHLDSVHTTINNLKKENEHVAEVIQQLSTKYDDNMSALSKLEDQIKEAKNLVIAYHKRSFLEKLGDLFK